VAENSPLKDLAANNPTAARTLMSIIINNYNYGRFLREAIDSALNQTYASTEVIVVDDGSTDNSREVIAGYGDRIIPVLKENGGQASAFNAGYAASSGDLILFLDSDDMLLPAAAATVAREWRDGTVLAYFPLEVVDAMGHALGRLEGGLPVPDITQGLYGMGSPTSGNVFSRKTLEKIMPIPEQQWQICADSYLSVMSSVLGKLQSLSAPLGKYRVHGNSNFTSKEPNLADTRRALQAALTGHRILRRLAGDRIPPLDEWLAPNRPYWVARITSLRESPGDHPWPDSLLNLIVKAVKATWLQPNWSFRRKLAYTAFDVCYSLSPKAIRQRLKMVEARARTPMVKRLLGAKLPTDKLHNQQTALGHAEARAGHSE